MPARTLLVLLLLLLFLPAGSHAQAPAFLVADLNQQASPDTAFDTGFSNPGLTNVGDVTYFVARTFTEGSELWRTDGSEEGTWMVRDIAVGPGGSRPQGLADVAGTLFFLAADTQTNFEVWKSDGTAEGTVRVKDVFPGTPGGASCPCAAAGGLFFFIGFEDGTELPDFPFFIPNYELWRSDGTEEGTFPVSDVVAQQRPSLLFAGINGVLVFDADDGVHGRELWRSDGTAAGTGLFADLRPAPFHGNPTFVSHFEEALYFQSGANLLRTDGSIVEPVVTQGVGASSSVREHSAVSGGLLYYPTARANVNAILDWELALTDGTAAGSAIFDLNPFGSSEPRHLADLDGTLLFSAAAGGGRGLWRSDGTAEGTALVSPLPLKPGAAFGGRMLLVLDGANELWSSDGTPAGTALIADLHPGTGGGVANPPLTENQPARQLFAGAGGVYFRGDDGASGVELWRSDGTAAGTALVKNIASDAGGSGVTGGVDLDGVLYFGSQDGVSGSELWRSDGSPEGTARVADLVPGPEGSLPHGFLRFGEGFLFVAGDALYRSDGSEAGTVLLSQDARVSGSLVAAGPSVFFARRTTATTSDTELWKTDGTPAGTLRVKGVRASGLQALGSVVLFQGRESLSDPLELWRSDGTEAGTVPIRHPDWSTSVNSFPPSLLGETGGRMLLGAQADASGRELWATDGTPGGTVLVEDILPGPDSSAPFRILTVGDLVFFEVNLGAEGRQIWRSDGTAAGTSSVFQQSANEQSVAGPETTAATRSLLFFMTRDLSASMTFLWASDGTAAGTRRVRSEFGFHPSALAGVGGAHVAFRSCEPEHGCEAWVSDGTEEGTRLLADVVPGPRTSYPGGFFAAGDHLYFWARDDAHGAEPWAVPLSAFQTACANGLDDDGDGDVDFAGGDPGCSAPSDSSEHGTRACDDGIDNDGDGLVDYRPGGGGDPGCVSWIGWSETSQCQDGVDNDGRPGTDFDGGVSVLGPEGADPAGPDPDCGGVAWRNSESPISGCGLGAELALLAPLLRCLRRRHC